MSGALANLPDLEKLTKLLQELPDRDRETSLFSIGGRGYYENPTSDLLAFFLRPDEDHGLGSLFLEALFATLPESQLKADDLPARTSFERVQVRREVETNGGKRLDLARSPIPQALPWGPISLFGPVSPCGEIGPLREIARHAV